MAGSHIRNRTYRYRLYPSCKQQTQLAAAFGCARFVYNMCLEEQIRRDLDMDKHLTRYEMNNYINHQLKPAYPFLREVDKFALTNSIYRLAEGFRRYYEKSAHFPRFKAKRVGRQSYTTNFTHNNIRVTDGAVRLPKLGEVRARIHRRAPDDWKLKSATVLQEPDGKYYVSIIYEYERNEKNCELPHSNDPTASRALGLDYSPEGLYFDSEGNFANMPHFYADMERKLAHMQKNLSRKVRGSGNYEKQKRKIAGVYGRICNQRKDYLHKRSTAIAKQYDIVCVEKLNLCAMARKSKDVAKKNYDNGYRMFVDMLTYKLHDRGKQLVKVDRWFPSSQLCSSCGARRKIAMNERVYRCSCGNVIGRDLNAAINIKMEGIRILNEMNTRETNTVG